MIRDQMGFLIREIGVIRRSVLHNHPRSRRSGAAGEWTRIDTHVGEQGKNHG